MTRNSSKILPPQSAQRAVNWIEKWFVLVLPASLAMNAVLICSILAFPSPTRAEDSRLDRLYHSYIAPCCWSRNLAEHDSEAARQVRARINEMVDAGRTDDEIKAALVTTYGRRILALPDGEQGTLLFATPLSAAAIGTAVLCWLLIRSKRRARPSQVGIAPGEPTSMLSDDALPGDLFEEF